MEREQRRREKSFLLFFFFLYFLPFFLCLCIFRPIFSAPIRRVTYIDLEKSSQHIAKHCQQQLNVVKALFYIFLFVVLRRFSCRAATYTKKKRDDDAEVLAHSRKVVSSPREKIWKYFPINLFTLRKGKGPETVHTLWQLHLYSEKHIECRSVIATLFSEKSVLMCCSTRRIDRLTDMDW